MPVIFFYFIGSVTGGFAASGDDARPDPLAVDAPADAGFVLDELIRRLEEQRFRVTRPETAEQFQSASRRLTVPAGDESGFTDDVLAGRAVTLELGLSDDELGGQADRVRVARAVYSVVADLAVLTNDGRAADPAAFAELAALPRAISLDVSVAGTRQEIPTGFEQAIPGTMVMFTMLVLLTSGSVVLVMERDQGLLRRMASTPISRESVVFGKWIGKTALGLIQIGVAMIIGSTLFTLDWGPALPMVGVVLVTWAGFNAALGIRLASVVRTVPQMIGIGVISAQALGALGGCWWPIEVTPDFMQTLALVLPTGWTMDAMHRLVSFGQGPSAALPHVAALVIATLAVGWGATRTFRYQ